MNRVLNASSLKVIFFLAFASYLSAGFSDANRYLDNIINAAFHIYLRQLD